MFAFSRFMGSSIAMIDPPLRGPSPTTAAKRAVALLDALAFEWAVGAAWTSPCCCYVAAEEWPGLTFTAPTVSPRRGVPR